MAKRVAPPPPLKKFQSFRETIRHLDEAQEVNQNSSLLSMFDDIMNQMKQTTTEKNELEDCMLVLAEKMMTLQQKYQRRDQDATSSTKKVRELQKQLQTVTTQLNHNSKTVLSLETENASLQAEIGELEDVVALCKEVILDNEGGQIGSAIGPEKKQRLIRAVSRQKSMKRRPIPQNRVIHETFEDDSQYDLLDNSDVIDRTAEDGLDDDVMNSSRLNISINSRKRQMSKTLRRRSGDRESEQTGDTDSFWNVKAPVRAKLKMSSLTSPAKMGKSPSFECEVCSKKIKFASEAFKCVTCRLAVHSQCRFDVAKACLVQSEAITTKRPLIEYCANRNVHPLIPQFVYQAVHEVDARILEEGIYRISGAAKEVNELKKKMISGRVTTQHLKTITDTNVICSTLKDFFRNMIDQPLLTWAQMPSFIQAYKDENATLLKDLFSELPDVHRDTLAFMLIHLIQVSQRSDQNRMTIEAISKSVGPSLIGFVTELPDANQIHEASIYQHGLLKALLNLGSAFFEKFMKGDDTVTSPVSSIATTCVTNHSYDAFGDIKTTYTNKSILGRGFPDGRKSNNKKLFS
ncbi:Oidioi.mRNA.OKI2018_I69.XSR.g13673.t1.cds [Oikopleura dioica]|uniref:Oidioi.mRNA.OKI2018_I69.XSR.g13673.t1.cds n=1 Tax=Oikopleura dioica TaxID=34765 RepID=A0ABN7SDQ0_OIKDI|nr:Oidioi.mRNA.OKI2018_I69.XSR.g13673.t1.cds [Oikopleura dioica]